MNSTIVIPTLEAARYARQQLNAIHSQTVRADLIVIDSSSRDGTADLYRSAGAHVHVIDRADFHHATTRNLGASLALTEFVVFLTQDSIPADDQWLENLLRPLVAGEASAAYSRQIARPDASPTEVFARLTSYPNNSRLVKQDEVSRSGVRAQFFSNSASAVRRSVLESVGWFPDETVQNEDMLLAAMLLAQGHAIAYAADSKVVHSHSLSVHQVLRRYFDIGTVFADAPGQVATRGLAGHGFVYVCDLLRYLYTSGQWLQFPVALAESAAKAAGLFLGRRYRRLPGAAVIALSSNPLYWRRRLRTPLAT